MCRCCVLKVVYVVCNKLNYVVSYVDVYESMLAVIPVSVADAVDVYL